MRLISVCLGIAMLASVAHAESVYRWTDAEGNVHFSESPPPGTAADEMQLEYQKNPDPEAAAKQHEEWNDAAKARRDAEAIAREQALAARREAAERQQKCNDARSIIARLSDRPAVRYKRDDGTYQRYADDEREAKIAAARDAERAFCY